MSAKITRLKTRQDLADLERKAVVRKWVLAQEDLAPDMQQDLLRRTADSNETIENRRPFAMIGTGENKAVVKWLRRNSNTPLIAIDLWMECFDFLDYDTQKIGATRDQLAEAVDTNPKTISTIMTELESIGAISRRVEKIPGMRGPGRVAYYMNPLVGTHLPSPKREVAQSSAFALKIVAK